MNNQIAKIFAKVQCAQNIVENESGHVFAWLCLARLLGIHFVNKAEGFQKKIHLLFALRRAN